MSGAPDPADFVDQLSPALRQAAAIACAFEGRVRNRPKTSEATEVKQALTIADTASQEAILVPLLEHFPQVCLAAEEDTPTVSRFPEEGEDLVVIDPIDGTLHSYLGGQGPYAVMVGLARGERFTAGLVALPREGLFFDAVRGAGARVAQAGGLPCEAAARAEGNRILVSHGMPEAVFARLRERGFDPLSACGGAVAVSPLLPGVRGGLRFASTEIGVSIRGRIGTLIAREAGACLRGASGAAFPDDLGSKASVLIAAATTEDLDVLGEVLASEGLA